MGGKSNTKILKEALEQTKKHNKDGNQRIMAYYDSSYEQPEGFPDLKTAPHNSLIIDGIKLINLAYDMTSSERRKIGDFETDIELISYGVGMERMLTGIYLKLKPDEFIQNLKNTGKSPSFKKAQQVVVSDFSERAEEHIVVHLRLMLEIIREHRNNEVHLGYHRYIHQNLTPLILEIVFGLGYVYLDEKPEAWDRICEKLKDHINELPTESIGLSQ